MAKEHEMSQEEIAAESTRQLAAFDQLPAAVKEFMRGSEIPLDAVETLKFVRQYGSQAFIGAAKTFIGQFQKQHPIVVGRTA